MGTIIVHRTTKTKDFTQLANDVFRESRLSYKAKGILVQCLSLQNGWNFSAKRLMANATDGERSVLAGLKELEELGYLKRTPAREDGHITGMIYEVFERPFCEPNADTPDTVCPQVQNVDVENVDVENAVHINITNNKKTIKRNIEEKEIYIKEKEEGSESKARKTTHSEEFEMLWSAYPRKQGKQGAYKAYIKALKDGDTFEEMMDGIRRYVEYIEAEGTPMQYVKMGQTFFNGRCWNDEFVSTKTARRTSQPVFDRQPQSSADYYLQMIKDGRFDDDE